MKKWLCGQNQTRPLHMIILVLIGSLIITFAMFYFSAYAKPYMQQNMTDISDDWQYGTGTDVKIMGVLQSVDVPAGGTLILTRPLNEDVQDAALMFKSNHQQIKVLLDRKLLFKSPYDTSIKNPGMALHFVELPDDYTGKLLQMEITSPYAAYSGAPGSVYLGDMASLNAYAASRSMLHTLLMVLCLAAGAFMMILAVLGRKHNGMDWGHLFFGVFSVLWGFYFPNSDFIVHQFFSPLWVSYISIGLYYLYPLPLLLYFYFQFTSCRKAFLPMVVIRGLFLAAAFGVQLAGAVDFPDMLDINNLIFVVSIVYMIVLGFIEMKKGSRFLRVTIPWILLVFLISLQSMISFYTTRIKQDETIYEMAVFTMIMVVWVYNLMEFLRVRTRERSDLQMLRLKNELALQNYENMTKHLEQVAVLRHEMKNHVAAIQILMGNKEYDKTLVYLSELADQQEQVLQVRYCEHFFLNALLNVRLSKLKESGVRISYRVSVPKELCISDEDLSSLFMNILDNASEALLTMPPDSDRWLELKVQIQKPYLYILCKNAKGHPVRESGGGYLSTKQDGEKHGFGLKIIRQVVEKYDGILNISHTANSFKVEAAVKETAE